MSRLGRWRAPLFAGYVAVTVFSFPHPIPRSMGDGVIDLGFVVAWWSPALLLLALSGLSPARAGRAAFAAGLISHALIFHWFYVVTVVYGNAPPLAGVLAPLVPGAYVAASTGIFGVAWAVLGRLGVASPLSAAALWTGLDHLRSFALSGFPWATLGYAQHQNQALMALAPYTGVYGLSFVTVLAGALLAGLVRDGVARRRPSAGFWAGAAAVLAFHGVGVIDFSSEPEVDLRTVRVAVLQGNIDQKRKWSATRADEILRVYEELTRSAAADGARIIVWPESSVPGGIEALAPTPVRLSKLAREAGAVLVLGAVGLEYDGESQPVRFTDSAFLVDGAGGLAGRYDKAHLVPFGEYLPLRDLLGGMITALARGIATIDVSPGIGPRAVDLTIPGGSDSIRAGSPICYELIFPDLVRRFVADGAEVLFAITNDAWYGRTGAPHQFLAITALRSAENRVWTARAANTGISAFIDARGRVRSQTRIFERGWLSADLPLRPAPIGGSFYTRYGDVFVWVCWSGVAALGLRGVARRGRPPRATRSESVGGGRGDVRA